MDERFDGTETERTILHRAPDPAIPVDGSVIHALVIESTLDGPRRHVIGDVPLVVGRAPPAAIVLQSAAVSRRHCMVDLAGDHARIMDLGSTNGTFVDGVRIAGPLALSDGAQIQLGPFALRYERRRREEARAAAEQASDLAKARGYVNALLPPPIAQGPVAAAWVFQPCATLGGDAFGYHAEDDWFFAYIIDVSGHGAGAAMHSVSVMNVMRQRALPGVDMRDPAAVLSGLNDMFDMDRHHGLYFTMWYGALHVPTRRLSYAAGGHHPTLLHLPATGEVRPLAARGAGVGTMPGYQFRTTVTDLPAGTRLHLFSDGAVELPADAPAPWGMDDVARILCAEGQDWAQGPQRLFRRVRELSGGRALDDDFSALTLCVA